MTPAYRRAVLSAKRLVGDYGIRKPIDIDVEAIALDRGLFVRDGPLSGAWARLIRKGNGGLIRISTAITLEGQRRFCIAHELGHFLLHADLDQLELLCTSNDMFSGHARRPEEPEANAFAGEMLMPEDVIGPHLDPTDLTLARLDDIAKEFRTTISTTVHRVVDVAAHVCALVRSEAGKLRSFHAGPDFPFRIREMRSQLDARSCAGEFFRDDGLEEHEDDVPADAWLDDNRLGDSETVRELTIPMPSYGTTLTLLWIVPGSELDYLAAE